MYYKTRKKPQEESSFSWMVLSSLLFPSNKVLFALISLTPESLPLAADICFTATYFPVLSSIAYQTAAKPPLDE